MKKILVIENWEETRDLLKKVVESDVPSAWNAVLSILLGKELKDVVEFEVKAIKSKIHPQSACPAIRLPDNFKIGDKFRVFVVKKEESNENRR